MFKKIPAWFKEKYKDLRESKTCNSLIPPGCVN